MEDSDVLVCFVAVLLYRASQVPEAGGMQSGGCCQRAAERAAERAASVLPLPGCCGVRECSCALCAVLEFTHYAAPRRVGRSELRQRR